MKVVRLVGMVFLVAVLAGALAGCGCFYQAVRGEKTPPAPAAITAQKPAPSATTKPGESVVGPSKQVNVMASSQGYPLRF